MQPFRLSFYPHLPQSLLGFSFPVSSFRFLVVSCLLFLVSGLLMPSDVWGQTSAPSTYTPVGQSCSSNAQCGPRASCVDAEGDSPGPDPTNPSPNFNGNTAVCDVALPGNVGTAQNPQLGTVWASGRPWYDQDVPQWQMNVLGGDDTTVGQEKFGLSVFNSNVQSPIFGMWGALPEVAQTLHAQGKSVPTGAIAAMGQGIAYFTSRGPVNTTEYIVDITNRAGFTQPAYAQGTGYQALAPILQIWKAFRNIAYLGFVIIFVIIGFMIMFRAKLGGQAAVTIQAALPQIIITLLLVTFSYAIASLVIDLIYVLIYLIIGTFSTFGVITDVAKAQAVILDNNWFYSVLGYFETSGRGASAVYSMVNDLFSTNIVTQGLGWLVGGLGSALAFLIFSVMILIAVFKVFFKLLMAYITIIAQVIFSPILLLFNAFPGSQSFMTWFKSLVANALLFPATALILLVGNVLLGTGSIGDPSVGFSATQNFDRIGLPFIMGGIDANSVVGLVGIGFILAMPGLLDAIQKMMGVEEGLKGIFMQPIASAWQGSKTAGLGVFDNYMMKRMDEGDTGFARRYLRFRGYDVREPVAPPRHP